MVKFIDAIPRARNGSILRRELVATFADEDDDDDDDE
jgi:acyl-coenzyme A synthetase/AMP-(fatty) acid ligase